MSSIEEIKNKRFREYMEAQLEEIYKFKWILGVKMHTDPLTKFSMNDISMMWILNNAENFRKEWLIIHGSGYFEGEINGIDN